MKRRELIRHIESHGCKFERPGGKHDIYWNPAKKKSSSLPRHSEINNFLIRKICKDLEIAEP